MAALALLAGGSFAAASAPTARVISSPMELATIPDFQRPFGGCSRTKRKVKGAPFGRGRRRKNPFRGTTYAAVIGVSSHIS